VHDVLYFSGKYHTHAFFYNQRPSYPGHPEKNSGKPPFPTVHRAGFASNHCLLILQLLAVNKVRDIAPLPLVLLAPQNPLYEYFTKHNALTRSVFNWKTVFFMPY
jgi:hypothetical protein